MAFTSDNLVPQEGGYGPAGIFNDPAMDWYAGFAPGMRVQRGIVDRTLTGSAPQATTQAPPPLASIRPGWRSPALADAGPVVSDREYKEIIDYINRTGQDANAYYGALTDLYANAPSPTTFTPPNQLDFTYNPNEGWAGRYIGGDVRRLEINSTPPNTDLSQTYRVPFTGQWENYGPQKPYDPDGTYEMFGINFRPLPTSPGARAGAQGADYAYPSLYGYIPSAVGETPKHNLVLGHELGHHVRNADARYSQESPSATALAMTAAHPNLNLDPQEYYGYQPPYGETYEGAFTGPIWNDPISGYAPMSNRDGERPNQAEPWSDQFARGLELLTRHGVPSQPVSGELYNKMYGDYHPVIEQAQNYLHTPDEDTVAAFNASLLKNEEGINNLDVKARLAINERMSNPDFGVPPAQYDKMMRALYMNTVLGPLGYPSLIGTGDAGVYGTSASDVQQPGSTRVTARTVPKKR